MEDPRSETRRTPDLLISRCCSLSSLVSLGSLQSPRFPSTGHVTPKRSLLERPLALESVCFRLQRLASQRVSANILMKHVLGRLVCGLTAVAESTMQRSGLSASRLLSLLYCCCTGNCPRRGYQCLCSDFVYIQSARWAETKHLPLALDGCSH